METSNETALPASADPATQPTADVADIVGVSAPDVPIDVPLVKDPAAPVPAAVGETADTAIDTKVLAAAVAADNTVAVVQGNTGVVTDIAGAVANPAVAPVAETVSTEVAPPTAGPIVALNSMTASAEDIKSSMLYRLECVLHAFEHVSVTAARDLVHAIHKDLTAL